jgi:hypothetical protein
MLNICIFNSFGFHFEMFGYLIDYCKQKNYNLDIYTTDSNNFGFIKFYFYFFQFKNFFDVITYKSDNKYDKIILTTDDDYKFHALGYNIERPLSKYGICIDHIDYNRNLTFNNHIGTRYFINNPKIDWALPVYRISDLQNKKDNHLNVIVCVGKGNIFRNIERFKDYDTYNFIIIGRDFLEAVDYSKYTNIKVYTKLGASEMIDILKLATYVFINDEINKIHISQSMSGSIPLALSCLCNLIMPKAMNDIYKFKSPIIYEENEKIEITKPNFDLVNEDLNNMLEHRNNVFDKYIKSEVIHEEDNIKFN